MMFSVFFSVLIISCISLAFLKTAEYHPVISKGISKVVVINCSVTDHQDYSTSTVLLCVV